MRSVATTLSELGMNIVVEEGQHPKALLSRGIYRGLCLACGGAVEDSLLLLGIPLCRSCLPKIVGSEGNELLHILNEYESKLFISQWIESVKKVIEESRTAREEQLGELLDKLRKLLGIKQRIERDELMKVLDSYARNLRLKILEVGRRLEEKASIVRSRIWSLGIEDLEKRGVDSKKIVKDTELGFVVKVKRMVEGFEKFFELCVGNAPWSIQRSWMYRIAQRQSFAMIAPTGVGKTTFGLVAALYLAIWHQLVERRPFRTHIIVPTRVLVKQYYERLQTFLSRLRNSVDKLVQIFRSIGVDVDGDRIRGLLDEIEAGVLALPPPPEMGLSRRVVEERVFRTDFYVLITTSAYIHAKFHRVLFKAAHPLSFPFLWAVTNVENAVREYCLELSKIETKNSRRSRKALVDEQRFCQEIAETYERRWIDFIFVDDVDAIMKGSRLIDYVLQLAGFDMGIKLEFTKSGEVPSLAVRYAERVDLDQKIRRVIDNYIARIDGYVKEVGRKVIELESEERIDTDEVGDRVSTFVRRLLNELRSVVRDSKVTDRDRVELMDVLRRRITRGVERKNLQSFVRSVAILYLSRVLNALIASRRAARGIVIVSSATGRARGRRIRFFRYLLGFDIGGRLELYRKIVDTYLVPKLDGKSFEEVALDLVPELVKKLGVEGGLVFVPVDLGIEFAEKVAAKLREAGIRAEAVTARKPSPEIVDAYRRGELQVLVGVAIYYGLLVRGLDLPERVRYAIFLGVPRHKINISRIEYAPTTLMRILSVLTEIVPKEEREKVANYMTMLRRMVRGLSAGALKELVEKVSRGEIATKYAEALKEIHDYVQNLLSRNEIVEALKKNPTISVIEEEGQLYMLVPDAPTYIQASGRTSRLFAGGITQGLSLIVVDDARLLQGLEKRMRVYIDDFAFRNFEELERSGELEKVLKQIEEDRKLVREVLSGAKRVASMLRLVETVLIVVESPNKARTIARFFGRPSYRDLGPVRVYEVDLGSLHLIITASGGHIYDVVEYGTNEGESIGFVGEEPDIYGIRLRKRSTELEVHGSMLGTESRASIPAFLPVYGSMKRCLVCGKQFVAYGVCPRCDDGIGFEIRVPRYRSRSVKSEEIPRIRINVKLGNEVLKLLTKDSKDVIEILKRLAMEVDRVVIGTDPDAEGEKIGFDLALTLAPFAKVVERMEFHEVTRKAILKALEKRRGIDLNMVEAQIARRIEDRWIGFALSDYLRLKIYEAIDTYIRTLSAGRVQTPTLGFVVRRHYYYTMTKGKYYRLDLELDGARFKVYIAAELMDKHGKHRVGEYVELELEKVSEEVLDLPPPPPFTTDELLSEASTVLRMDVAKAMNIAQQLFELGLITYHRTDSTRVSDVGIAVAKQYLESIGLGDLFVGRTWARGVVGAHECIRPTRPIDVSKLRELIAEGVIELPVRLTEDHYRLYDLVFRRFMASQMQGAKGVKRVVYRVKKVNGIEIEKMFKEVDVGLETKLSVPLVTDIEIYVVPQEAKNRSFLTIYVPPPMAGRMVERVLPSTLSVKARVGETSSMSLCVRMPSQGDVIRWMKEHGVGRPSTYAKIVSTLIDRRYVKESGNVVVATTKGVLVYSMLTAGRLPPDIGEKLEDAEKLFLGLKDENEWICKLVFMNRKRRVIDAKMAGKEVVIVPSKGECREFKDRACIALLSIVELGMAKALYDLVSVRATANLVRAMEEIEMGKRFYHTVLESVLAEIWRLFNTKFREYGMKVKYFEPYWNFVKKVEGIEEYKNYLEFVMSFEKFVKEWMGKGMG